MLKNPQSKITSFTLPDLGSLWMLVAALGFAVMGALVKVGAQKFSSPELVFYRSIFGLLVIWLTIFSKNLPLDVYKRQRPYCMGCRLVCASYQQECHVFQHSSLASRG